MEDCKKKKMQWVVTDFYSHTLQLQCVNHECKLHGHCGRNHYEEVAACPGCILSIYSPCEKEIHCCKCMEENCSSRKPCEKRIV